MKARSRSIRYLSIVLAALILLIFPLSAMAQSGTTTIPDLNGDGKADLLWYNPATGQTIAWLMDGTVTSSSSTLLSDPDWKITGTGDFNGDGMADLLWYNAATGQTVAWLMNGTSASTWTPLLTDANWKVTHTADLNGDGMTDLIWYNAATGQTAAWLMNGTSVSTWTPLLSDPNWKVIATGDLNGDHKTDLIWYNAASGETAAWLMNGTSASTWTPLFKDPTWKVIATADFNGDGKADLLWYDSTSGQTSIWLMNGTSASTWTSLPTDPNSKVIAIADFNGDGKADLLWYNAGTGETFVWLMNGAAMTSRATLMTDTNWRITATADLNGDGKTDLLWYNSSTGQTSAWLMDGVSATSGANLFTDPNWRLKCIRAASQTSTLACVDTAAAATGAVTPVMANRAPSVNAGPDQSILSSSMANLSGAASDDGLPIGLVTVSWSQAGGPGVVTFGNAKSLRTTAAFSAPGTYTLRLTATDSAISTSDDVVIVVSDASSGITPLSSNRAPSVNAGLDQAVTLPALANLLGTATDDGLPTGTLTALWMKLSGPGSVQFGNAAALTTTASFSAPGTYTLRLTVSDSVFSTSDDVIVTVNTPSIVNQAPVVFAGPNQMITLPATAALQGSASDDGLPTGSALTVSWSKVSGPGSVTFGNAAALNTSAIFSTAGTYTLRLTASDGALSTTGDTVIVVSPIPPANQAPVVSAGASQTVSFPGSASLQGSATDDGLPNGSTLSVTWSKLSGPGSVVFVNANSLTATATFMAAGSYTLRLTATDGLLTSTSDVAINVISAGGGGGGGVTGPSNQAPTANAGIDQLITLPGTATLLGTAGDDGLPNGSTLSVSWTKISGPGTVSFGNPAAAHTVVTFSVAGTYTLRLTASDSALSTSDDVVVIVNAASAVNQAPTVNAGPDQAIAFGAVALLQGSATDDGLPLNGGLTVSWTKINGPGLVTFGNAAAGTTAASFSVAGTYTLRLTASDSALSASDDIVIVVNAPAQTNRAPVVSAGSDQSIAMPMSANLMGTASDDNLPLGSSLSVSWSKVSGPGSVVFVNANSLNATATFLAAGSYVLRLTASDGALSTGSNVSVTVSAATGRAFYIDFGSGSDSNSGTSKSAPWKHAPGMQGATGLAASTTPQGGDQLIFKGGVTWDHTAFQWNLSWKGRSGQPIYIGVDPTWFVGSSWTRPIFSGDHVALAAGSNLIAIGDFSTPHIDNYITLDNIELKGLMAFQNTWPALISHSCTTYFVMQNLYIHDWQLASNITTDDAHGGVIGNYPSCRPTGTKIAYSVISNSEARDSGRQNGVAVRSTDVEYSVIHDVQTAQLFGLVHDSEYYNVSYPALGRGVVGSNMGFDPTPYHENVTYVQGWDGGNGGETRPGMIYNNVFHDISAGSGAIYPNGCPATAFYIFNNVVYNNYGNQDIQIEQYGGSGTCGEYHIWNNTLQVPSSRNIGPIRQVGRGLPIKILDLQNNHFIQDSGTPLELNPGTATLINSNNVSQSNAAAAAQGYSSANRYATAVNGVTFNSGKNLSNLTDIWLSPLNFDILNRTRPATWDAGAYQHLP